MTCLTHRRNSVQYQLSSWQVAAIPCSPWTRVPSAHIDYFALAGHCTKHPTTGSLSSSTILPIATLCHYRQNWGGNLWGGVLGQNQGPALSHAGNQNIQAWQGTSANTAPCMAEMASILNVAQSACSASAALCHNFCALWLPGGGWHFAYCNPGDHAVEGAQT